MGTSETPCQRSDNVRGVLLPCSAPACYFAGRDMAQKPSSSAEAVVGAKGNRTPDLSHVLGALCH